MGFIIIETKYGSLLLLIIFPIYLIASFIYRPSLASAMAKGVKGPKFEIDLMVRSYGLSIH